jgi:peptidoglycan/xylan/chitin deacetylase (PgdA/CDA1 family)
MSSTPRVLILGYHEVSPDGVPHHEVIPRQLASGSVADEMQMYTITTEAFRQQLDALAAHGYMVIPLSELVRFLLGQRQALPERSAVITVDDGWASLQTPMLEELRACGDPATAFVYPHVIDRHDHHPFNLTWDQVAELAHDGVDIESHTLTHPFLSRARHKEMDDAAYARWLADELAQSRDELFAHVGGEVRFLAYPYGDYDAGVETAARAAGYTAAVTVSPGLVDRHSDPLALPRYLIFHDTSLARFESWLEP